MRVLVLGKGSLGNSISLYLNGIGHDSLCVSLRHGALQDLIPNQFFDVIIDSMDLSHDLHPSYESLQDSIRNQRHWIITSLQYIKYIYISSANIYAPSRQVIHEQSSLLKASEPGITPYLVNKITTESFLYRHLENRLIILRPVSLWSHDLPEFKDGFFADLLKSRREDKVLPSRPGDESIISFMNYRDAARVIAYVMKKMHYTISVWNITSWQWASRTSLKNQFQCHSDSLQRGRRVSSLYYSKTDLPFSFQQMP